MGDDLAHVEKIASHVSAYVGLVQADDCTLGWALEKFIAPKEHIVQYNQHLTTSDRKKVEAILVTWEPQFFTMWACVANLLDPWLRGRSLTVEQRWSCLTWQLA